MPKFGYNKLFMEWGTTDLENFYQHISEYYQNYKYASDKQLFCLFELSKKCLGDNEYSVGATLEGQIIPFEAVLSGLQVNGFEGTSREAFSEKMVETCEVLADKQRLGDLVLKNQIEDLINITAYREVRDWEIVNNFVKLHNGTLEGDGNIIIAGLSHCVDFYNYANTEGILDEFKFVQIRTNLTTLVDEELGDIPSTEIKKEGQKYLIDYVCGDSLSNQVKENLEYFGLTLGTLCYPEEDFMCKMKYNNYIHDQINVIRCDINVNDPNSYQTCLYNVTHTTPDIV